MLILSQNPDIQDACTIGNIKPEVEDRRTVRQWGERVDTVITDQLADRHCNFYQGQNTWLYLLWAGRKRPWTGKIIHVVILGNADTYLVYPEVFDCDLHKFEVIVGLLETLHSADPVLRLGGTSTVEGSMHKTMRLGCDSPYHSLLQIRGYRPDAFSRIDGRRYRHSFLACWCCSMARFPLASTHRLCPPPRQPSPQSRRCLHWTIPAAAITLTTPLLG